MRKNATRASAAVHADALLSSAAVHERLLAFAGAQTPLGEAHKPTLQPTLQMTCPWGFLSLSGPTYTASQVNALFLSLSLFLSNLSNLSLSLSLSNALVPQVQGSSARSVHVWPPLLHRHTIRRWRGAIQQPVRVGVRGAAAWAQRLPLVLDGLPEALRAKEKGKERGFSRGPQNGRSTSLLTKHSPSANPRKPPQFSFPGAAP